MLPMPATWWSTPDNNIERVGEQVAALWKSVRRAPSRARASRLGVSISPPKAPMSEKPRSSATMTRMLGREPGPAGAALADAAAAAAMNVSVRATWRRARVGREGCAGEASIGFMAAVEVMREMR